MKCIAGIFWNDDERRIRALWRLVAQTCMLILVTLILQYVLVLVFGRVAFVAQPITPWQVDPKATNALFRSWSESFSHAPLFALRFVSTLVCIWLAGRVLDRRQFAGFGLHISRDWLIDLGFGLLLGAFLITSVFLIEVAAGWVIVTGTCETRHADHRFAVAILSGAVTMLLIGAEEELLGRGYQLTNLVEGLNCRRIGPRWSVIIASLLSTAVFALLHAGNPHASTISTFSVFMGGITLALGYILTGELAIPIGLHITWNFCQSNVFGFQVSGMDLSSATFIATERNGPELWIGDASGPEAGLLALCAVVLGCLLILLWVRLRYGHIGVHVTIAEAPGRHMAESEAVQAEAASGELGTQRNRLAGR